MTSFIKANVFQIILVALLTILVGIGGYFVRKAEANERRIVAIEEARAVDAADIRNLQKTVDDRFAELSKQIERGDASIGTQLKTAQDLIKLLLEKGN